MKVKGKFLFAGESKFYVRGVTYGPFRPAADGCEYHDRERVARDFAQMEEAGVNAVRCYTVPPRWLLDKALEHGIRVLVGVPWEQHVTFLNEQRRRRDIEKRVRAAVHACATHPALLGYAIGNEIPAPLVRWYGHRRVERFLERLYYAAKSEDPTGLVTYVNYPSTEYLELPFLDFVAFNVYLESPEKLRAYLARMQNNSGDRPVLLGEIGLDSLRNGEAGQAESLEWQGRLVYETGGAGLFFFSWTDEWHRGGHDIEDWQFGLTRVSREPKPALRAVRQVFGPLPYAKPPSTGWPSFSVVVCSYNGSRTLGSCLEGLQKLDYPDYEIILVNDGSKDATAAIGAEFGIRVITIPNGGLSNARNVGWQAAQGELVAYIDDDAAPDPQWLRYLAATFAKKEYAGVGGPNIAWPEDGWLAICVDHAPGNPTHVLLTDQTAEHLPGCNMAFRKSCLRELGGFDTQFRIAGDDVDFCWRLLDRGWKLGFHPGAMVWHHRRGRLRGYWRQQLNYGKAEAMLERKWPEKYNAVGHATWNGRLYGKGPLSLLTWSTRRIYHGTWGTALFQSLYSTAPGTFAAILMLPEWYLIIALLAIISACAPLYAPLRFALFPLALAFIPPLLHAGFSGARSFYRLTPRSRVGRLKLAAGTAALHFLQPAARLWGRLCFGLTPWRKRGTGRLAFPWLANFDIWSEGNWQSAEQRLTKLETELRHTGAAVRRGGDFDRWDLEVRGGLLGTARLLMVIEEHGEGKQFIRMRLWPVASPAIFVAALVLAVLGALAALDLEWTAWALLNLPATLLVGRALYESAHAMGALTRATQQQAALQDLRPEAPNTETSNPPWETDLKAAPPPVG